MDFTFTEEQSLMADSLRKAYESDYDFDKRRVFLDDTATFHSPAMWQTLADNGFLGLLAPEEVGGFDGGGRRCALLANFALDGAGADCAGVAGRPRSDSRFS